VKRAAEYAAAAERELELAEAAYDSDNITDSECDRIASYRHGRALVLAQLAQSATFRELTRRAAELGTIADEFEAERYRR
jgi:hypothetical protein